MGSWGLDPFDNDDAGDWSWTLEDGAGPEALRDAFAAVATPSEDPADGANAVAAASLVAAARGVAVTIPESMQEWLAAQDVPTVAAWPPRRWRRWTRSSPGPSSPPSGTSRGRSGVSARGPCVLAWQGREDRGDQEQGGTGRPAPLAPGGARAVRTGTSPTCRRSPATSR